ncbi:hypothetical protein Tco_0120993 [Tanacetum coccineum]
MDKKVPETRQLQTRCRDALPSHLSLSDAIQNVRISQKSQENSQKNKQARTRESEEYKAEARKVKPQSKSAKKNQTHAAMKEAQIHVGFCAKTFRKEAQVSLKRIATLAIRVRSLIDLTAKIFDPMIDEMIG